MKTISFSDILVVDQFKGLNEFDLLHPNMDQKVNEVLSYIGFDTDYPVVYYPAKHRNMQNKITVGFLACGEVSLNRSRTHPDLRDITDYLVCASYHDISLMKELAELAGKSRNFDGYAGDDMPDGDDERALFPIDQQETDYLEVAQQIKMLENIRDGIRGPMYSASGAMKMPEEYQAWLDEQKELEGIE